MLKYSKILLVAVLIITAGTAGYHFLEGWGYFDSFYMTIITLATVGYNETHPLSLTGRVFTIIVILVGVGGYSFLITYISQNLLNTFFHTAYQLKKMEKKLKRYSDHYIVCGYGRIGKTVSNHLKQSDVKHVVIDISDLDSIEDYDTSIPYIPGDASHDEILLKAGIREAKGLISVVHSEADNVFITLTARELKPDLYIIARYEEVRTKEKLRRAGASRVINPYQIGSERISNMILQPTVSHILEKATRKGEFDLKIEEFQVRPLSGLVGKTLMNSNIRDNFNVLVIAIDKGDRDIVFNPKPDYLIMAEDRLVLMGNRKDLDAMKMKFHLKV